MLTSPTISNHPTFHWALTLWLYLVLFFAYVARAQAKSRNITISNASSQIVYTPFLCNATTSIESDPPCPGAWQLIDLDGITFVTTTGPDPAGADIIPQMFFQFRASAMYLTTSPFSNATANITISADDISVDVTFNSSVGNVAVVNLREDTITTAALTFFPDPASPSRLDIGNITLTITDHPASTVIFPSMTLPPTATLPTFLPPPSSSPPPTTSPTPTPAQGVSDRKKVAEGVGIVLGLGLGLTAVAVAGYVAWRYRRRHLPRDVDSEASTGSSDDRRPPPPPPPLPRPKQRITEKLKMWF